MSNFDEFNNKCLKVVQNRNGTHSEICSHHYATKFTYTLLLLAGILVDLAALLAMVKKYRSDKRSQRKHVNKFAFCLAILCFADLAILALCGLSEAIQLLFDFSVRSSSVFACKFLCFACYVFSSFVAHLYVFIAMDRWEAATRPLKYKQRRMERSLKQIFALFLYCFCICLPFVYFPTLSEMPATMSGRETHEMKCKLPAHLLKRLTLLDAVFYSFLPFVFTLVFSSLTLIALVKERRTLTENKIQYKHNSNKTQSSLG